MIFEDIEAPAYFSAQKPILQLFAQGKTTGMVIKSGAESSTVTPIVEGYSLLKNSKRMEKGGETLTHKLLKEIEEGNQKIYPYFDLHREGDNMT